MNVVTADELKVVISSEFKKVLNDYDLLDKKIDKVNKKFERQALTLKQTGEKMTRYLTVPIAAAGVAAAKFAMDVEDDRIALEVMLKSAEKAARIYADFERFAASTPFETDQVAKAGKQLIAFQSDAGSVIDELRILGDVAAGVGIPLTELAEIYGKARIQQTLFAEDINQLAGRGIPVFEEFATVLGVGADQVKKLASEGKITFDVLTQAFDNMTSDGGLFFDMMERRSKTASGKLSTTISELKSSLAGLGEEALPVLGQLFDMVTNAARAFNDLPDGVKQFIIASAGITAAAGPMARMAGSAVTIATKLRALGPIMRTVGPALLTPWGAVAATVIGAATAVGIYIARSRQAAREFTADTYSNPAKYMEQIRQQWIQKLSEYDLSEIDLDASSIENYVNDFNAQLEKIGATARITRDDVIQALVDITSPAQFDQMSEVLALNSEDLLAVSDPTDHVTGIIEEIRQELESQLGASVPATRNTWREFWAQVFSLDSSSTAGQSGANLANDLIAQFEHELSSARSLSDALGKPFDEIGFLEDRVSDLSGALQELLGVDPDTLDDPFKLQNDSIKTLISYVETLEGRIKDLKEAEKTAFGTPVTGGFGLTQYLAGSPLFSAGNLLDTVGPGKPHVLFNNELDELIKRYERIAWLEENGLLPTETQRLRIAAEIRQEYEDMSIAVADAGESMIDVSYNGASAAEQIREEAERIREEMERLEESLKNIAISGGLQAIESAFSGDTARSIQSIATTIGGMAGFAIGGSLGQSIGTTAGSIIGGTISDMVRLNREIDDLIDESEQSINSIFDSVLSGEERLHQARLDFLNEELDVAREAYNEQMDAIRQKYDLETEVLYDQWQRNLITTDQFTSEMEKWNQAYRDEVRKTEQELDDKEDAIETEIDFADTQSDIVGNVQELVDSLTDKFESTFGSEVGTAGSYLDHPWNASMWGSADEKLQNQIYDLENLLDLIESAETIEELYALQNRIPSFGEGGTFVTNGPQLIEVGDNPGGREIVDIQPMSGSGIRATAAGDTYVISGNTFNGAGGLDELIELLERRRSTLQRRGKIA